MKHAKVVCLLGLLLLLISTGLYAEATGNDLLSNWESWQRKQNSDSMHRPTSKTIYEAGRFEGFVEGCMGMLREYGLEIPDDVTYGQIYKIVGKYLEDHPAELHRSADKLIQVALTAAFPPKK